MAIDKSEMIEFEKIKLVLALKELRIIMIKGDMACTGYLSRVNAKLGSGQYLIRDKNDNILAKIGKTEQIVANQIYEWVIKNDIKI